MNEVYESKRSNHKGIILYSTGCPKCKVLKAKLTDKRIIFSEFNDKTVMAQKGILKVPMLEVDDMIMDFVEANDWVNGRQVK